MFAYCRSSNTPHYASPTESSKKKQRQPRLNSKMLYSHNVCIVYLMYALVLCTVSYRKSVKISHWWCAMMKHEISFTIIECQSIFSLLA